MSLVHPGFGKEGGGTTEVLGADPQAAEGQGGLGAKPSDVNGLLRFSHKNHSF